jgi:hypothetical protein
MINQRPRPLIHKIDIRPKIKRRNIVRHVIKHQILQDRRAVDLVQRRLLEQPRALRTERVTGIDNGAVSSVSSALVDCLRCSDLGFCETDCGIPADGVLVRCATEGLDVEGAFQGIFKY